MDLEEMLNYASHELEPQARVLLATWEQLPLLLPLPCARRLPLCAVVCVAQQPVRHVLTGPCVAPTCRPAPHPRSSWPCASCATGAALLPRTCSEVYPPGTPARCHLLPDLLCKIGDTR